MRQVNIAVCTIGSRGDVQPFLLLARHLQRNSHDVRVCSAELYRSLAESYEVAYHPFEGNYQKLVDSSELKKAIGGNPFRMGNVLKQEVYPILENSLEAFYELAQWADAVVYHPKTMIDCFGTAFQHKLIKAYVIPAFTPTSAFPSPILGFRILRFINRWTYRVTNALMGIVKQPVKNFQRKHGLSGGLRMLPTPILYGISESFLPRPTDYPEDHQFTGFWMEAERSSEIEASVTSFFQGSKKVIILTFGSMPYKSKVDVNVFIQALIDQLDVKVCVVRGWGLKDAAIQSSDSVLVLDTAPFDALFPLADGIVHHGGAGTTAIALKAGIPQMICPVLHPIGDQWFWGKQVEKRGLGVAPVPLKKLTVSRLVRGVTQLLNDEFPNLKALQSHLQHENGLEEARRLIEGWVGR